MTMKKIITTIGLLMLLQNAWAIDIRDAKAEGLVGEANVNAKRKAQFEATARKTGAKTDQVAYRFYELAVQKTAPGGYYQDSSGRWKKK